MSVYFDTANLQSVRQALGMATLRKAMNQDAESVASILKSMEEISAKTLELSVTPHKGSNVDIRV